MSETYNFVWGEVPTIKEAIRKAESVMLHTNICHIETDDFDLDFNLNGITIHIPHINQSEH